MAIGPWRAARRLTRGRAVPYLETHLAFLPAGGVQRPPAPSAFSSRPVQTATSSRRRSISPATGTGTGQSRVTVCSPAGKTRWPSGLKATARKFPGRGAARACAGTCPSSRPRKWAVPSLLPVTIVLPWGLKAMARPPRGWVSGGPASWPVGAPQPGSPIVAAGQEELPVGAERHDADRPLMFGRTPPPHHVGVRIPNGAISSLLPVATILPSRLKATAKPPL